jgi:hypothetical protein
MADPIHIWRCNEGTGSTLIDSVNTSGNLVDATNYDWATGHGRNAYSFSPTAGKVWNGNFDLGAFTSFSVAWWAYLTGTNQGCIFKPDDSVAGITSQSKHHSYYDNTYTPRTNTTELSLNTWYHIGLVVTSTTYQWYLNGIPDGNGSCNSTADMKLIVFGSWTSDGSNFNYPGNVNDFYFWNEAVSQSDIQKAMGISGGPLVGASALVGGGVLCGQGNLIN